MAVAWRKAYIPFHMFQGSPPMPSALNRFVVAALLAAFCLLGGIGAASANPVRTENVEASITAESASVPPGQTVWVAMTQKIRPRWHTYWKNPGDSGLATEITWTMPSGWAADPIVWAAPKRLPVGPLVNFGYEGEVHFLQRLTVPANARPGETVDLTAEANWLVCEDICIPESATLSLKLPVAAGPTVADPSVAPLFAAARAALPTPSPFPAEFRKGEGAHSLVIAIPGAETGGLRSAFFFPEHWAVVPPTAAQTFALEQDRATLALPAAPGEFPEGPIRGVLRLEEDLGGQSVVRFLEITAPVTGAAATGAAPTAAARETAELGFLTAALFALLGGVILNLMPCVFPVLSMKALALVRHEADHARTHGLVYTAGVLVSFALVAGALIALRAGGAGIGWGFQLQDPLIVGVLAYVMLLLALQLSGVFELGGSLMGVGQGLASRDGYAGSFFTGVLATLVATPCTAPFMGAAIGYALLQPWPVALTIFLALGLGMALPFLILTASPGLLRRLPRPGVWMERVKQGLAFPLYATAAWLVWVLSVQAGPTAVAAVLSGMVLVAFAAWLFGVTRNGGVGLRRGAALVALAAMVGAVALARVPSAGAVAGPVSPNQNGYAGSVPYDDGRLAELTGAGKPVFVNLTAAWCITCKVNEQVALSGETVKKTMADKGIVYMVGDWTRRDATIARVLERFGRNGVPLYLVYLPGAPEPLVLPQLLTEAIVLQAFDRIPPARVAAAG